MNDVTEYRAFVTVPDLPLADEERWKRVIEHLERHHGELGPVIGWDGDTCRTVLSLDAEDEASASGRAMSIVAGALHEVQLGTLYPAAVHVERASADEPQLV